MSNCPHGDRVRVTARARSGKWWAAFMCPVKDRECPPEWVPDAEVYQAWKEGQAAPSQDDTPPF